MLKKRLHSKIRVLERLIHMTTILFKAVAVDMDGTFLTDNKTFDHELFGKILKKLQTNNIPFI